MKEEYYFIKLIMLSRGESDLILLYGFAAPTVQKPYPWKHHNKKGMHGRIYKAILSEDEMRDFLNMLTRPGTIALGDKSFISPELIRRSETLSNDGSMRTSGPISKYRQVIEFWNVQKQQLFEKVKSIFCEDGRQLYNDVKELFSWVRGECGINILNNGWRFGNFELYKASEYMNAFKIEIEKEPAPTKTSIIKKQTFQNSLIVNCTSVCRGRSVINQSKIFLPEEECLDFIAEEPMSNTVIQIWDQKSGKLIFSRIVSLLMNLSLNIEIGSGVYRIRDPWTKQLFSAAADRSEIIRNQIETVTHTATDYSVEIKSRTHSSIDNAINESNSLFDGYKQSEPKGAFIAAHSKDGEIESFLKVLDYIRPNSVKKVVIADPYFSVRAAEKILTRIPRTDIQVDVITSRGKIDPDTGSKIPEYMELQNFLTEKTAILHNHLFVCNLQRGGKQVFHDRYLIRYFDNGSIDGFLLSNSLNAMGQFYPFVIAPLEHDVCLEVCDYLNAMCDPDIQGKQPKKERITCNVLYNSEDKIISTPYCPSEQLPLSEWLAPWCNENLEVFVPVEDLSAAVAIIWKKWRADRKLACRVLSMLAGVTDPWSPCELADVVRKVEGAADEFRNVFVVLAREVESARNHEVKGLNSPEYRLWALLNGTAQPSHQGFPMLFQEAGHIWYSEYHWLTSGYNLLLCLYPDVYAELLKETKSPMMFDVLAARMCIYSWNGQLFDIMMKADSVCVRLLCVEWIFAELEKGQLSGEEIENILEKHVPEKRILPIAYLISKITFYFRNSSSAGKVYPIWEPLYIWLIDLFATDAAKCACEVRKEAIDWLDDCEEVSNCKLHFHVAKAAKEQTVREELLKRTIELAQNSLLGYSYENTKVPEIVDLYVSVMELLYGQETEGKILGKFVDWNVFETAVEPELKNYAYKRWHCAYIRAKWQMEILHEYYRRHPEAGKTSEWIDKWEEAVDNVVI